MTAAWERHLVAAHQLPNGRMAYQGVIRGPAASGSLEDLGRRPTVWGCHHRHRLARVAVDCAAAQARRWGWGDGS